MVIWRQILRDYLRAAEVALTSCILASPQEVPNVRILATVFWAFRSNPGTRPRNRRSPAVTISPSAGVNVETENPETINRATLQSNDYAYVSYRCGMTWRWHSRWQEELVHAFCKLWCYKRSSKNLENCTAFRWRTWKRFRSYATARCTCDSRTYIPMQNRLLVTARRSDDTCVATSTENKARFSPVQQISNSSVHAHRTVPYRTVSIAVATNVAVCPPVLV